MRPLLAVSRHFNPSAFDPKRTFWFEKNLIGLVLKEPVRTGQGHTNCTKDSVSAGKVFDFKTAAHSFGRGVSRKVSGAPLIDNLIAKTIVPLVTSKPGRERRR